jgi:autotransporter-associated beta strand protein
VSTITYTNGSNNSAPIVLSDDSTQLEVDSGSATQSGAISESGGSHGITKVGAGTLILAADETYTGFTTIGAGTLIITSADAATGETIVNPGAALDLQGVGSLASSRDIALNSGSIFDISATNAGASIQDLFSLNSDASVLLGTKTLTITNGPAASGLAVFAGNINGSGGVTIAGGTSVFSGVNSYTGVTKRDFRHGSK